MDVDSIQETAHTPYYGPWSAWSPWSNVCHLGMVWWQRRERTREVGETWSRRKHHEDCDFIDLIFITSWLQTTTDGPWETVTQTSTATQTEYRTLTLAEKIADWRLWKMAVLPTVYRGDRLHLDWRGLAQISEVTSYRAELDGQPLEDDEFIFGEDIAEGHHAIDLHVETAEGSQRYQIAFASAARFVAWFPEPVLEVQLPKAGRPNGTRVTLAVANRSGEEMYVRPTVTGVPAGWKAVFLDESPAKLGRGRQREFELQIEAMTDAAIRQGPLPLTVGVKSVGRDEGADETACASCVIHLTGDAKAIKQIESASSDRMRRHRPLLDIELDGRRRRRR